MSVEKNTIQFVQPEQTIVFSETGSSIALPAPATVFEADFLRDGPDLLLVVGGEPPIRVVDYFRSSEPADLVSSEGAILRGQLAATLAGPETPGQYAQAGGSTGAAPIGQVELVGSDASVQRTDGTVEPLQQGSKIFLNDVLVSGPEGSLSVTFVDGTIFSLSPGSRMIIDELIYSPASQNNSATFNLIQGGFVFIAGQVASTGGMDVTTPAATMGIRGTSVLVDVQSSGGIATVEVTLTFDPTGHLGRVALFDLAGDLITTVTETDTKWIVTSGGEAREVERSDTDIASDNVLITEAVAAYQAAFLRFDSSGRFVELESVGRGDRNAPESSPLAPGGTDGIDLDNQDADEIPELAPGTEPRDADPQAPFDEGRNLQLEETERNIILTAFEDLDEDTDVSGNLTEGVVGGRFEITDAPDHGNLSLGPDGSFTYVPEPNFNGVDRFDYSVTSGSDTQVGTVTIQILPVNDAPSIDDQQVTTVEDKKLAGVAQGRDVDGDALTYNLVTGAANGLVVVSENGTWVYTPDADFAGTDSFEISVSDTNGASVTQQVTVSVEGENDAPIVTASRADARGAVTETVSPEATGQLGARDADAGAQLVWSGAASGIWGDFAIDASGAWRYIAGPAAEALAAGQQVVERFTATVTDDQGARATQEVRITLTGSNDGPVITSSASDARGAVTETVSPEATGQLGARDADAGAQLVWSGAASGSWGDFAIDAAGAWRYIAGPAAEALAAGQQVVERFTATVTDDQGASATQEVRITLTGSNDGPVALNVEFELVQDSVLAGNLTATDVDASDSLTFAMGATGPQNGTLQFQNDGSFVYTPDAGFRGLDGFDYTVSDGNGGVDSARANVFVESASQTGGGGQQVTLNIYPDPVSGPAGSVVTTATSTLSNGVNLVIAMDASGSIGPSEWQRQIDAVGDALEVLQARFSGAATQVDVHLISYATSARVDGTFDLSDAALIPTVRSLPYLSGRTNWTEAFQLTETFFDSQPVDDANFLYFITDGVQFNNSWVDVFDRLTDEVTKGYSVDVTAFGIGGSVNLGRLRQIDPDADLLAGPADLTDAFVATPLFSAQLVDLSVSLIADGQNLGLIADETLPGIVTNGIETRLALADIPGLADLLGDSNRFYVTAGFDLDGNPSDSEIDLFSSEVLGKASDAQTITGTDESDLIFGSDFADTIDGAGGNDVILGFGGADRLITGGGIDTVLAGSGDDRIVMNSSDAPGSGLTERLDGGAGRDILEIGFAGDVNAALEQIDLSGVEAIDMTNGAANRLELSLADIVSFSDEADSELEQLLADALDESVTIYGDGADALTLMNDAGGAFRDTGLSVLDGQNTVLEIYTYASGSDVLATLAVDADVSVTVQAQAV